MYIARNMDTEPDEDDLPLVSDCCGSEGFEHEDYGICPSCKEHCEFVKKEK